MVYNYSYYFLIILFIFILLVTSPLSFLILVILSSLVIKVSQRFVNFVNILKEITLDFIDSIVFPFVLLYLSSFLSSLLLSFAPTLVYFTLLFLFLSTSKLAIYSYDFLGALTCLRLPHTFLYILFLSSPCFNFPCNFFFEPFSYWRGCYLISIFVDFPEFSSIADFLISFHYGWRKYFAPLYDFNFSKFTDTKFLAKRNIYHGECSHVHLRRMWIMRLLFGVFYICLLYLFGL